VNASFVLFESVCTWLKSAPWRDERHLQTVAWMLVGWLLSSEIALTNWAPYIVRLQKQKGTDLLFCFLARSSLLSVLNTTPHDGVHFIHEPIGTSELAPLQGFSNQVPFAGRDRRDNIVTVSLVPLFPGHSNRLETRIGVKP
jgi:hypothetical protein